MEQAPAVLVLQLTLTHILMKAQLVLGPAEPPEVGHTKVREPAERELVEQGQLVQAPAEHIRVQEPVEREQVVGHIKALELVEQPNLRVEVEQVLVVQEQVPAEK